MRRRFAVLLIVALSFNDQAANSASIDDTYRQAVAEANANSDTADYAKIRDLYSLSSFYRRYDSDPLNFQALTLMGKTPSDKDIRVALERDFALPGMHLVALGHFKSRLTKEESALHIKHVTKLIEAIVKTGIGVDEARAMKVLVASEEYLIMASLQMKHQTKRLVTSRDGKMHFDVFDVTLSSGKKLELWFDVSSLFE